MWQDGNSLLCQVPLTNTEPNSLTLEWSGPDGKSLSFNNGVQLNEEATVNLKSLSATFETLSDGNYSCVANLTLPQTSGIMKTVTSLLLVKSKSKNCVNIILLSYASKL